MRVFLIFCVYSSFLFTIIEIENNKILFFKIIYGKERHLAGMALRAGNRIKEIQNGGE